MHFLEVVDLVDNLLKGVIGLPLQIEADGAGGLVLELHFHAIAIGHVLHDLLEFHIIKYHRGFLRGDHRHTMGVLYLPDVRLALRNGRIGLLILYDEMVDGGICNTR